MLFSIPVPPPTVDVVSRPNTTTLFTTQQLNLTCYTILHPAVDTAVGVANTWSGPAGVVSPNGHITVVGVAGTSLEFNSSLRFSSLRSSDSGTYTCFSTVSLVSSYIASGESVSASVVVTASKWLMRLTHFTLLVMGLGTRPATLLGKRGPENKASCTETQST